LPGFTAVFTSDLTSGECRGLQKPAVNNTVRTDMKKSARRLTKTAAQSCVNKLAEIVANRPVFRPSGTSGPTAFMPGGTGTALKRQLATAC
jgi:hypothetical protein